MHFEELLSEANKRLSSFNPESLREDLSLANNGAILDVFNKESCGYYCWLPGLVQLLKPKIIVELGAAMGVADICILASNYQEFDLWAITLREHGLEFAYIKDNHRRPNFHPIIGNDLDLNNWPEELDLSKTDLWFFDSDHTETQLRTELELYKPFFRAGAIILFDDMELNPGMSNVLQDLENIFPVKDKMTDYHLHWSGFTIVEVGQNG